MRINSSFLFPISILVILLFGFSIQLFNLPPIGSFLDPGAGICQNGPDLRLNNGLHLFQQMELKDSTNVYFDDRRVPHIYAKNEEDLFFAQGYVTASLRLWQMDFISYVSAGRLSEIFVDSLFLKYDRKQRRIGVLSSAKKSLSLIEKDEKTIGVLNAYTKGVNVFINELNKKNLPIEYKLLDYTPEPWTNLKSVLVLKYLATMLTGYEEDMYLSQMYVALGKEKFNKIFPEFHNYMSPITPSNELGKFRDSNSCSPNYIDYSFLSKQTSFSESPYNPKLGSNSWAVSGKKAKSGYPILCNDPHLNFSLPCIWLEMQLSGPALNVYGVSIPGTPGIVIGFNNNIAWGVTNGCTDVKDWYKLRISKDYSTYEFNGKLMKTEFQVEEIKRRGLSSFYDTIYNTIHGPIVIDKNFKDDQQEYLNHALKWELQNASNEFSVFLKLNKCRNYSEFKRSLANYSCPIQNFTFASKDDTIAIHHEGKLAVKWPGQGRFILDGTKIEHLYSKYIPKDSLPRVVNPECGYVLSANQHPTDRDYKYYYNGYYGESRANQINSYLNEEQKFDLERMKKIQLDNVNPIALKLFPELIRIISSNSLDSKEEKIESMIKGWKCDYGLLNQVPTFYEIWLKYLRKEVWNEIKSFPFYLRRPDDYVLLDLIKQEPNSALFDDQNTKKKETASDIVIISFRRAVNEFLLLPANSRAWGDVNKINLVHMTNLPAFSELQIPTESCAEAICAIADEWGPSWRMIVQLGERPCGFGIYPGGQSGNLGNPFYNNFVHDWKKGQYYKLTLYLSETEANDETKCKWKLR